MDRRCASSSWTRSRLPSKEIKPSCMHSLSRVLTAAKTVGLLALASCLLPVCVARAEIQLTFGLYSSKKPTDMVKLYRPLLNQLESALAAKLGEPVVIQLQVAKTYEEGSQSVIDGTFDISQLGPVSYIQLKEKQAGVSLLAIEGTKGRKALQGVICVLSNAIAGSIKDLRGKKFAFGDQYSTTGRYSSQMYLAENGITAKDLGTFNYLERHDKVGAAVAAGDYDAGALNERTFKKMVEDGSPLRALARFPIDGRPWVSKAGLDPRIQAALKDALININDPKALAALGEENLVFLPGTDADFEATRKAIRENGRFIK
ncbi:MAG: phosphonate ABC transporter substrate-binding protein [Verrucomicrobia bacterium]|nr:phosphonate ABC transporter substrate-binding protein [Verrucomicrobiota bacterium]